MEKVCSPASTCLPVISALRFQLFIYLFFKIRHAAYNWYLKQEDVCTSSTKLYGLCRAALYKGVYVAIYLPETFRKF